MYSAHEPWGLVCLSSRKVAPVVMVAPSNKLDDLTSAPGVETLTALFPIPEFSDIAFRGTAPRGNFARMEMLG